MRDRLFFSFLVLFCFTEKSVQQCVSPLASTGCSSSNQVLLYCSTTASSSSGDVPDPTDPSQGAGSSSTPLGVQVGVPVAIGVVVLALIAWNTRRYYLPADGKKWALFSRRRSNSVLPDKSVSDGENRSLGLGENRSIDGDNKSLDGNVLVVLPPGDASVSSEV